MPFYIFELTLCWRFGQKKTKKMVWPIVGLIVACPLLRLIRGLWRHNNTFFAVIGIITVAAIWTFSGFWNAVLFLSLTGFFIINGFQIGSDTIVFMDKRTSAIKCSECGYNHVGTKRQNYIQVV